jgi:hypothetical protein
MLQNRLRFNCFWEKGHCRGLLKNQAYRLNSNRNIRIIY